MGFYCYNCGKEVQRHTKSCPSCGVVFKAVKCPSCGYTDEADFFKGGCPRCGYMGTEEREEVLQKKKTGGKSFFGFVPPLVFWSLSGVLLIILFLFINLLLK